MLSFSRTPSYPYPRIIFTVILNLFQKSFENTNILRKAYNAFFSSLLPTSIIPSIREVMVFENYLKTTETTLYGYSVSKTTAHSK